MSLRGYAIDWHGHCPYCGCKLSEFKGDDAAEIGTERSKDHIIPQRVGGTIFKNLVWACIACNRDKHHLSLTEWRVVRAMRGQSPFFAWDSDVPVLLWRWLVLNVYLSGSLSKLLKTCQI